MAEVELFIEQELVAVSREHMTFAELRAFVEQGVDQGIEPKAEIKVERTIAGYLERISCPVIVNG